jgi:hypothetical protein
MGVNIPKLLAKSLKPLSSTIGLRSAVLVKSTPGIRTVGSVSAGTNPTTTSYPCQALIEVVTVDNMPGTLVQVDDRKIGVLGATLPAGVVPSSSDKITLADIDGVTKTFRLIAPVSGDGVGALYEFIARN